MGVAASMSPKKPDMNMNWMLLTMVRAEMISSPPMRSSTWLVTKLLSARDREVSSSGNPNWKTRYSSVPQSDTGFEKPSSASGLL